MKFQYNYNFGDQNVIESWKRLFVTPQSLSNWVYEKIESKFDNIVSKDDDHDFGNNHKDKVVSGASLSNYIYKKLIYEDTPTTDSFPAEVSSDRLVLRRNLLHYVQNHKYVWVTLDDFDTNDFNYITPSNLKRYFDTKGLDGDVISYISSAFSIDYDSITKYNMFDDSTSNTLVSLGTLSNLLFDKIRYDNNDFKTDHDNFVSSSNVASYITDVLTERTFTNYSYLNFQNDNETFVSSSNVATYINDTIASITYSEYNSNTFENENNKFVSSSNVAVYTKELIETYKNESLNNFDKKEGELFIPEAYLNDFVTFSNLSTILFDESFGLKFEYDYQNRLDILDVFINDTISYISPFDVYNYLASNTYNYNQINFPKTDSSFIYTGNEIYKLTTVGTVIDIIQNNLRYVYNFGTFAKDEVSMLCPKHVDDYITENIYEYNQGNFIVSENTFSLTLIDDSNFNIITIESLSNILLKELRYTNYDFDSINAEEFVYITPAQTVNYVDDFWETKTYIYDNATFDSESNQFISPSNVKQYLENNITNIIVNNYGETTVYDPDGWNDLILDPTGNGNENKLITLAALSNILFEVESVQNQMKGQVSSEKYNVVDFYVAATAAPDTSVIPNYMKLYRSVDKGSDLVSLDPYYDEALGLEGLDSYKESLSPHNDKIITFETHFKAFLDFYNYIIFPEQDNSNLHYPSDTSDTYSMSIDYSTMTDTKYDVCFLTTINLSKFIDRNLLKMVYAEYDFGDDSTYYEVGGNYKNANLSSNIIRPANKIFDDDHGDINQIITKNVLTHYIDDYFKKWTLDHVVVSYVPDDDYYFFPLERYSNADTGFITSNDYNQLNSIPSLGMVRHICDQVITTFDFQDTFSSFNLRLYNAGLNVGIGGDEQLLELSDKGTLTCGSYNSDSNIYMRTYVEHSSSIDDGDDSDENKRKLFQVGCGNGLDSRDNAFEVLENGDVYVKGSIILNNGKWRIALNDVGDELQLQKGEVIIDANGNTSYVYTTKHTFI